MKKQGILNAQLSRVIGELGHTDEIVIADAGLPVPPGVERIDLALSPGVPSFREALEAVLGEMQVERAWLAEETGRINPRTAQRVREALGETEVACLAHEALKARTRKAKAVVRTGECTPYANVILSAGVTF